MFPTIISVAALLSVAAASGCVKRQSQKTGDDDGHYCVCNATYCDETPIITRPRNPLLYQLVSSSKSGLRFDVTTGSFTKQKKQGKDDEENELDGKIAVNHAKRYQTILGFGTSITDSVGINIRSLSNATAERLLRAAFGPEGLEYSFIRTPIGGTDFSTRPYTYAMVENDTQLRYFELPKDDYVYRIPFIKKAKRLSKRDVKLVTAAWSASPWMKTPSTWAPKGKLRREYWQLWAEYLVKFFQAYKKEGLEFWATSPQNEPQLSTYSNTTINGMSWEVEEQRDWIIEHLAPALKKAGFDRIKILVGDENRSSFPEWARVIMENKTARDLVAGSAFHWYFDKLIPATVLDEVKAIAPEKHLLYTEACNGVEDADDRRVILGSWVRGESYADNIIDVLSHWVEGWIDWNMALDVHGGPTWVGNYIDSAIIVNSTADEFYKQPMYYALGHFSKYVPPNSVRIHSASEGLDNVTHVAFLTPDRTTVLIILNKDAEEKQIQLSDRRKGVTRMRIPGKSLHTVIY